jgi:hypothetical protein
MTELIFLIFALLTVHIIGDFWLQPNQWVECKNQHKHRSPALFFHALIQGSLAVLPILFVTSDFKSLLSIFLIVGVSHWLIDLWKTHQNIRSRFFVLDQMLHSLVLVLIAIHATGITAELFALLTINDNSAQIITVLFAYLLITKPSSIAIGLVLSKYSKRLKQAESDTDNGVKDLLEGGQLIGYLERLLILTFTLQGSFAAVGFVLASKSVFRFGELRNVNDRAATEYVLIGSMLSVTLTVLLGIITTSALKLVG